MKGKSALYLKATLNGDVAIIHQKIYHEYGIELDPNIEVFWCMKKIALSFVILLFLLACGDDAEPEFNCPSGAKLLIGEDTNHCGVMSRFSHKIDSNRENYKLYLDYFPYGNMDVFLEDPDLLQEGATYQRAAGANFNSAQLSVNSGSITIDRLDRENKILTISFQLTATVLDNNTRFEMSGTLSDLPLTAETN